MGNNKSQFAGHYILFWLAGLSHLLPLQALPGRNSRYQSVKPTAVGGCSGSLLSHVRHRPVPNRLTRIRFKLQDLFNLRSEGFSALIAYAGSAHTVAPLTDDSHTLINLTKALAPEIMPVQGNNPTEAVRLAKQLLTQVVMSLVIFFY